MDEDGPHLFAFRSVAAVEFNFLLLKECIGSYTTSFVLCVIYVRLRLPCLLIFDCNVTGS